MGMLIGVRLITKHRNNGTMLLACSSDRCGYSFPSKNHLKKKFTINKLSRHTQADAYCFNNWCKNLAFLQSYISIFQIWNFILETVHIFSFTKSNSALYSTYWVQLLITFFFKKKEARILKVPWNDNFAYT